MKTKNPAELRALARARIKNHELPCAELPTVWAGAGSSTPCSLCHVVVSPEETAYEVEVEVDGCTAPQTLHLHIPCHEAWLFACNEGPLASTA